MLKKSGRKSGSSPQQRLLSLFDILADWLDAPHPALTESPHIRETINLNMEESSAPNRLLDYLTEEAKASGAQMPDILAQQLYFMALGALQEESRTPGSNAIHHAQKAAKALIRAQTQKEHFKNRPLMYGLAASLFVMMGVGGLLVFGLPEQAQPTLGTIAQEANTQAKPVIHEAEASPTQTAAMFASIEQMRTGVCQYPEALALPEAQQAVYIQNVIGGQVSSKVKDQELARNLMQKVRCDYAPMLMKNSIS